jgi:hypothetical protein
LRKSLLSVRKRQQFRQSFHLNSFKQDFAVFCFCRDNFNLGFLREVGNVLETRAAWSGFALMLGAYDDCHFPDFAVPMQNSVVYGGAFRADA